MHSNLRAATLKCICRIIILLSYIKDKNWWGNVIFKYLPWSETFTCFFKLLFSASLTFSEGSAQARILFFTPFCRLARGEGEKSDKGKAKLFKPLLSHSPDFRLILQKIKMRPTLWCSGLSHHLKCRQSVSGLQFQSCWLLANVPGKAGDNGPST